MNREMDLRLGAVALTQLMIGVWAIASSAAAQDGVGGANADASTAPLKAYVTFTINVSDDRYATESADTLLRLVDIFERNKVRGDFFFTAAVVERYAELRPDVIQRFKETSMTINYQVSPPHPLYPGFEDRFKGVSGPELSTQLRDYETYRLDPATGDLDRSEPGGFIFVKDAFDRLPVAANNPCLDPEIRAAAFDNYYNLGARMTVLYSSSAKRTANPFLWMHGLLLLPNDFSVLYWVLPGELSVSYWWNRQDTPQAAKFNPTAYLKKQLKEWKEPRTPFVTVPLHELNFHRFGLESWNYIYFEYPGRELKKPPYNLNAPDRSRPRKPAERERIWKAYEELVSYAATDLTVVSSEDILEIAQHLDPSLIPRKLK
ncbi:MAG: hypothetical protein NTX50_32225 [Candidatus Sumerlaeota bacterium]|nr:hypothetical protein [Candidatus Sumerlaeota bacterium]